MPWPSRAPEGRAGAGCHIGAPLPCKRARQWPLRFLRKRGFSPLGRVGLSRALRRVPGAMSMLKPAARFILVSLMLLDVFARVTPARADERAFALGQISLSPSAPLKYRHVLADTIHEELGSPRLMKSHVGRKLLIHARL